MLERMKNVLKNRKDEGDKGFSLVELAVVIVIIGILVAIAIPVFANIQQQARVSAGNAAVANAASSTASILASDTAATAASIKTKIDAELKTADVTAFTVAPVPSTAALSVSNFCVTPTLATGLTATEVPAKGPGCP